MYVVAGQRKRCNHATLVSLLLTWPLKFTLFGYNCMTFLTPLKFRFSSSFHMAEAMPKVCLQLPPTSAMPQSIALDGGNRY